MPTRIETVKIREVGQIREIKKDIAKVTGLESCMNGQLVDITQNSKGMIMGFVAGEIPVLLLGKTDEARVGDKVYSRMEPFKIPVGENFVGRAVNALAEPIDGKGPIEPGAHYSVFRDAPSVLERIPITETFETGVLIIDSTIPIGKGQRELIIGDRMTGKTAICTDAIINQKGKDIVCIYCCVGRAYSTLERIAETLKVSGAMDYSIIVSATASCSAGEQYLAPYTACALGEYFMDKGKHVFVVFDDLTKHAWIYRQISLLLERPPGREAYPGDVFYLHSQLMERAGKLSPECGGGSMTFFPIVETLQGDVTGYISSNLVSMTDGQIYLNTQLFNEGFKPAVDTGLSVSRIGNKAQCPAVRELSAMLRLEYIQYNDLLKVTRFKTGMSDEVTMRLKRGEIITQLFLQDKNEPYPAIKEIVLLYALRKGVLDVLSRPEIEDFKRRITDFVSAAYPGLFDELSEKKDLSPEVKKQLNDCIVAFFRKKDKK
ncbi:MAG: F0F1 ATP synthase subunit alpha [Candidatus Omnitrophota bacterium]